MAHRAIGLDLGSCKVKAVALSAALRGKEVAEVDSEPVLLGADGRADFSEVLKAAGRVMGRFGREGDTVHCAVQGEAASVRQMVLPIGASRRLAQVLKFQLDELLPFDINDAVFDFVETGRGPEGISVLAVTVLHGTLEKLIRDLGEHGISPREIGVGTLSYGFGLDAPGEGDRPVRAVLDIGHERTNIMVLDPKLPTARTVLRGGRDLTAKLAEAGAIDFEKAEAYKRQYGLTGKPGEILKQALRPLVREINQTLKGHLAQGGQRVGRVLLAGGTSLLPGIDAHLADELGVPVDRLHAPVPGAQPANGEAETASFVLAHALAKREDVSRARRIDLRRGDLAFKGDYEFLRRKLGWAAACFLAVICSWLFATCAEYRSLGKEAEQKRAALETVSQSVFGRPILDSALIKEELDKKELQEAPIPKKDAFDIVVELSRRIPTSVVHDIELLEIKAKRVVMKGEVDSKLIRGSAAAPANGPPAGSSGADAGAPGTEEDVTIDVVAELSPTDLIKQNLEEFKECFTQIRVANVSAAGERRRYQMEIESLCP